MADEKEKKTTTIQLTIDQSALKRQPKLYAE